MLRLITTRRSPDLSIVLLMASALLYAGCSAPTEPVGESAPTPLKAPAAEPSPPQPALSSDSAKERLTQVKKMAARGEYQAAIEAFESVRLQHPKVIEPLLGLQIATVYASLNQTEEHEALCTWMFDQFPGDKTTRDAELTGKAYVVYSGARSGALLAEAAERTRFAVEKEQRGIVQWFNASHGIAAYRLKDYGEASVYLKKGIDPTKNAQIRSLSLAYLAMVAHAQGESVKGQEFLAKAKAALAELPKPGTKDFAGT